MPSLISSHAAKISTHNNVYTQARTNTGMMHKTKQSPRPPQKASSLNPEDKQVLSEFIVKNRSLLEKLSKL